MNPTRWLCLPIVAGMMLANVAAAAGQTQDQRELIVKTMKDGNFNDAYEGFRKLALDPEDNPLMVGDDLKNATSCLQRLNRVGEIDAFREAVIEVHKDNWQLLRVAAENYMSVPHHGFVVVGEFNRGNKRGNQGGQMVNAAQRDRIRALQLMAQALPLAKQDDNHAIVGDYLLSFARILLNNRGWSEAWRLQYKSELDVLPDYDPGYGYNRQAGGAPVDAEGNPVLHYTPKTFEESTTDGQRWRWCLEQAMEFNPAIRYDVKMQFADFMFNQFGVQTMAHYGWRFGRVQTDDTKEDESGTYALHTLKENETIARLATGVKRFELPDEFNFVKIFQAVESDRPASGSQGVAALQRLVQVFENRRQYPKAAGYCRQMIAVHKGNNTQAREAWQKRLDQIVGAWGRFEQVMPQPAGQGASVEFRFRNGNSVEFTAKAVKVKKLLDDVKAYLKSNPNRQDRDWHRKVNIANIGYRLIHENQAQYVGEQVAQWDMKLDPRENHFDKRVTVSTPLQEPGAYLLTSKMPKGNTNHIIIWVADTAIVKKPLDGKMYYYVADAVSGKPIEKANLEFFGYRMQSSGNNPRTYKVIVNQFAEHTDRDGQVFTDAKTQPTNLQWIITATTEKGRFAYLGFTNAWYGQRHDAEYKQVKAFAITDRPVYRPDQTVHWKFWVRHAQYDQEDVSQFAKQKIGIEIYNPKNERIVQKELVADEYGGIQDDLELPADATLGVYRMTVGVLGGVVATPKAAPRVGAPGRAPIVRGGPLGVPKENVGKRRMTRHYGSSTFRVEEYKKPEFEVTVDAPTEPVMLGEKITATINAKYYFGSPVTDAKVKYKILRTSVSKQWYAPMPWDWFYGTGYWWYAYDCPWYPGWKSWGCRRPHPIWWPQRQGPPEVVAEQEVKIGKDGTVKVEIDTAVAKAVHPDQDHKYSITAEVVDQSRRTIVGSGDVLVARKPFKVHTWVDRGYYRVGDTIQTSHSARTLDGKPVQGEGKIVLYRISYKDGKPVETAVGTRDLATNAEGRADRKIKATRAGQYRISYTLTDSKKHTIEGGYLFTIIGEGFDGSQFRFNDLELIPDKREYANGEKIKLQVNTNRAGGTVLLFVRPANSVYLAPQVIRLDGKSTVAEIAVSKKDMPNFFVEAV
ncbi:MAG: alpha-2-macroglobulin, partial [Candidatus Nealsonbacteria bacterium]|nr:alpha-2-macroglobulin [Candidatus Nealsonbacteria bacterium]